MRIIHQYLLKKYLAFFFLTLSTFVSIYIIIEFLEKIGKFTHNGASFSGISQYFFWLSIDIIYKMSPLACLMAAVLTISSLAKTSELTAFQSGGVGIVNLSRPIFGFSALLILCSLLESQFVLPEARSRALDLKSLLSGKKPPSASFKRNNIWYREQNTMMQALNFTPVSNVFSEVTLWKFTAGNKPAEKFEAQTADYKPGSLLLKNVTKYTFKEKGVSSQEFIPEKSVEVKLVDDDLKELDNSAELMSQSSLYEYCKRLDASGAPVAKYMTMFFSRISEAFTPVVLTMIAIPFAVKNGRNGGAAKGIAFSLAVGFIYYILTSFAMSLGQSGSLHPLAAAFAVNTAFLAVGFIRLKSFESR